MPRDVTLLISPFFYPEIISTGKYNTILATHLRAHIKALEVICAHPFYPEWRASPSHAQLPQIKIIRGGGWLRYPKSVIARRLLLEIWFAVFVLVQVLRQRKRIRSVIVVFPPVLFALALRAIIPKSVPLVGIVHDVLGIMARSNDNRLRRFVAGAMARVERTAFSLCDRVVCLSRAMRDLLSTAYEIPAERTCVLYPFAAVSSEVETAQALEFLVPGMKNIVYSGALGEKQVPDLLFGVLNGLAKTRSDVVCHICSAGPIFDRLKKYPGRSERFLFHPLVEEDKLADLYAGSLVQIVPQAQSTGAGAFPSKYPNLVATGTPTFVICDKDSELDQIVARTSCAISTDKRSVPEVIAALSAFIDTLDGNDSGRCRERNEGLLRDLFDVQGTANTLSQYLTERGSS